MKKHWLFGLAFVIMITALCGCGTNFTQPELSKEIDTTDGGFVFYVPEGWSVFDEWYVEDCILSITKDYEIYADIYFYSDEVYDFTEVFCLNNAVNYYDDNMIGDIETLDLDGMTAYKFQYSKIDIGADGLEYNYHGFVYMIDAPSGVIEANIYYSQTKLEKTYCTPSADGLNLLQRIIESIEVI
ncbi:MAG: hypothetical protein PHO15_09075 [Eubacteriales bacterium]|nr:hypothetical protein [Eubacteriales bacterium]